MAFHRTARPPIRTTRAALASLAVAVAMVTALPMADGDAAIFPGKRWHGSGHGNGNVTSHNGNGKFNKNNFSVNSPSFFRGNQQVSNQNLGGHTPTQTALCQRKFHHCRIKQRIVIEDP